MSKDFSIDTKEELLKILEATNNAKDLNLYVRIAISNEHAEIDLSENLEPWLVRFLVY